MQNCWMKKWIITVSVSEDWNFTFVTGYCLVDLTGEYSILSTADDFAIEEYKKAITQIGMNLYKLKVIKILDAK